MSLKRALGPFDATMVVVGGIIGSGIFVVPAVVAQRLPTSGLVLTAWMVGGGIALAGAFAFAELATLFPQAGGEYAYLREAYHPLVAFLFGWASLVMIQGGGLAAVAVTFAQYALKLIGRDPANAAAWSALAIAVVAGVNFVGVKPGSRLLNVLVISKMGALGALIFGGLLLPRSPSPPPAAPLAAPSFGFLGFGAALVPILFAYGGWQSVNLVAEETREPRRTIPIALLAGMAIVIVVYMLANVVYLAVLSRPGLASTSTPAADALRRIYGSGADRLVAAAIAISAFGFLDLTLLAQTRIYYAMGRDGVFLPGLARLHPKFQTPALAIFLQAGWGIVLALTGTFGELVDSVVFGDWIFFGLTVTAIFVFRRRIPIESREPGSFRTPGYPLLPALFVAGAAVVVVSAVRTNPFRSAIGMALLAIGLLVYWIFARRNRRGGVA
ncbi:MAG TPA: amino acid permease [Thermoanaerobaculia bacterium]